MRARHAVQDGGLPAFRAARTIDKVYLPADAAVQPRTNRVRAHLAGDVYFNGRVDRDHALILGDTHRIVHVLGGVKLNDGIVVNKIV